MRQKQKEALLVAILKREKPSKVLIFTATREGTSEIGLKLRRHRYEVVSLSSMLSQSNRERALAAFRRGEFRVLVATDVAARGLDIDDIDLVVNFDVPMHPQDYVHRIGRTGRASRTGRAVTLVSELDDRRIAEIEKLLGYSVTRTKLEGFSYDESPAPSRRPGRPRAGAPGHSGSRSRRRSGGAGGRGRGRSGGT